MRLPFVTPGGMRTWKVWVCALPVCGIGHLQRDRPHRAVHRLLQRDENVALDVVALLAARARARSAVHVRREIRSGSPR